MKSLIIPMFAVLPHILHAQQYGWSQMQGSPVGTPINSLTINSAVTIFAATGGGGVYRSANGGQQWEQINNGLTNLATLSIISKSTNLIIVGTEGPWMFRSTNTGDIWSRIDSGLWSSARYFYSLRLDHHGNLLAGSVCQCTFEHTENAVFRSTDDGLSWSWAHFGYTGCFVSDLATNDSNHIFAASWPCGVWRSTDNGSTWSGVRQGLITSIAVDSAGYIYAGEIHSGIYAGGMYRSTNNGNTWTTINNGLTDPNVRSIIVVRNGEVFIGTSSGGVFHSSNSGQNWAPINSGLTDLRVRCFTSDTEGFLYAGTDSGGVFRTTQPITSVDNNGTPPASFRLFQNYPNPFNPSTTIKYDLPLDARVALNVFDVLGIEVLTLVDEQQTAGNHTATFDASAFSSGVYFYRIQAGELSQTKKLIILK